MSSYSIPDEVAQAIATWLLSDKVTDAQRATLIGAQFLDNGTARRQVEQKVLDQVSAGLTADEEDLEDRIELEVANLRVRTEAERRLASEDYSGSEELTWEDLEDAETRWLVNDLVPEEGVCFLVARSNLGKTFTYIDMVGRMSQGLPFLGKQTRPAKTLIVLGEGKAGFIDRLKSWCKQNGTSPGDLRPWLSFIDRANLNNDESLARITEVADREGVELVVFDTWAATSGIHKEEDNALNAATLNRVKDALPGRALYFVHHPRKAEEDTDHPVMRGAGSLFGAAEVVTTMYRDRGFVPSTGEKKEFLAFSTEAEHGGKNRVAVTETIRGLYLDEVELDNGEVGRALAQVTSEAITPESRKVRELVTTPMSVNQFVLASGLSQATAYRYLKKAVEDGVLVKEEQRTGPAVYRPTQAWSTLQGKAAEAPYAKKDAS